MPYRGRARGRARPKEDEDQVGPPTLARSIVHPGSRSSHSGDADVESLRSGLDSVSLHAPAGFADAVLEAPRGRGLAPSAAFSAYSSVSAAAQPGQAAVAREAEPGPGAIPKSRGASVSGGSSGSGSGRGAAAPRGPELPRGGATPSVSGRSGRGSDYLSEYLFGGYSKENKKEYLVCHIFESMCVSFFRRARYVYSSPCARLL